MARPFTRAQALQNAAFLKALRETGNVHEAARRLGVHRSTYTKRRAGNPAFAADWDAALAIAQANLLNPPRHGEVASRSGVAAGGPQGRRQTNGTTPEPRVVRTSSGRLQLRRHQPGRLTRAAEQAFLSALSATANVRLSAAAAGFSHSAFYHRRRTSPAFAREMHLALQMGYDRVELALIESVSPAAHADDAWRHNDPPPIPSMTADQALQLLHLHQKEARLIAEPPHIKRRRGESHEAHSFRLCAMHEARMQRDRDAFEVAEAERQVAARRSRLDPSPPALPALDQVTGWSKAKLPCAEGEGANTRKTSAEPLSYAANSPATGIIRLSGVALFGGWRLDRWGEGG